MGAVWFLRFPGSRPVERPPLDLPAPTYCNKRSLVLQFYSVGSDRYCQWSLPGAEMYPLPLPVALAFVLFSLLSPVLTLSTRASPRGRGGSSSSSSSQFGFHFCGTNAYWLPFLNSDDDIRNTLANMSKSGISVVRTWAFNDVPTIPDSGSWLHLIKDGNTTFNTGPNGIQRLDKVIELAKEYNIYVYFSLTNNWFPIVNAANDSSALPRNYLSNYYGGMDVYVQEFGAKKTHDEFYTNKNIRKAFYKYVRFIVSRYANEPGIIAWELANDAECASTLPSSDQCNTNTLTRWHAETAKFIRSIDCNHLIASGVSGSLCPNCPKLFPPPPPPKYSPTPGSPRKRTANGFIPPGKSKTKRQGGGGDLSVYNGAFGVDSQDILNAPDIDFGTFQLFPDLVNYGAQGTASDVQPPSRQFDLPFHSIGKPVVLSAFGIITQDNLQYFVPVSETSPVVKSPPNPKGRKRQNSDSETFGTGVNQDQINTAYSTWLQVTVPRVVAWTSQNLVPGEGTPVPIRNPGGYPNMSPNDGCGIAGHDEANVPQILQQSSQ
ncbi:glycoside hydrolase superfamily [Russula aff. rugulosa BPL654]|nr:glycoside hydrolase superfamily [Russula aff. rugulosa BPL654]